MFTKRYSNTKEYRKRGVTGFILQYQFISATVENIKKINKTKPNENLLFFTEQTFLTPFTKFGKILSSYFQDIERKCNYDGMTDGMTDNPNPIWPLFFKMGL